MDFEYVQDLEADEKLRRSRENRHIREAEEKGITQGKAEEKQEIAKNLLLDPDLTIDKVIQYTGLTKNEILSLKEEFNN